MMKGIAFLNFFATVIIYISYKYHHTLRTGLTPDPKCVKCGCVFSPLLGQNFRKFVNFPFANLSICQISATADSRPRLHSQKPDAEPDCILCKMHAGCIKLSMKLCSCFLPKWTFASQGKSKKLQFNEMVY